MKLTVVVLIVFFYTITETNTAQVYIKTIKIPASTPVNAELYIAGDFNNWNPADENYRLKPKPDGNFGIEIDSKVPEIAFKFTLGSWEKEECNLDGSTIQNRIYKLGNSDTLFVTICSWKNKTKKSTRSTNVHVVQTNFYMPQFDRTRKVWIYLPPDYDYSTSNYPVLYMHDAQNLFDDSTSYAGEWNVDESLNQLFSQNKKGVIVVGIEHGDSLRINELTPWTNEEYGGGDGASYAKFIVETLKPYIDSNYRTLPDRDNTGVMGSSLGGLVSFYMAMQYPEVFSKVGVFSPSFWFSDECYTMAENYKRNTSIRMFILAGGREYEGFEQQVERMEKIFRKNGFSNNELIVKIVADGTHSEQFWRSEFPSAIKWLFH